MNTESNELPPRDRYPELLQAISEAQVVRAIDKKTGNVSIIFGIAVLNTTTNQNAYVARFLL
jgi:hypothetical protein